MKKKRTGKHSMLSQKRDEYNLWALGSIRELTLPVEVGKFEN